MTEPENALLAEEMLKRLEKRRLGRPPLTEQEARDRIQRAMERYVGKKLARELAQAVKKQSEEEGRSP